MNTQTNPRRLRVGRRALAWAATLLALTLPMAAQNFDNGSTGALGDVVINANTVVPLPDDGILHYKSLVVNANFTLSFTRNAKNTPAYILSKEDVTINGRIDVSGSVGPNDSPVGGRGGPGGFDGGAPGFAESSPGPGQGPGGGREGTGANAADGAGSGSFRTISGTGNSTGKGTTYGGALLIPLIGGSGGGGSKGTPGRGGGGGGGAILISSNTRITVTGSVYSQGGNPNGGSFNGGSGGAVRFVAPIVAGTGEVNVSTYGDWAGRGRVRVDALDRSQLKFNFQPDDSVSVGANLFIFAPNEPRLDVVQAAGNNIPLGSGPVTFQLPFGSDPNKSIVVRATGWGRVVPIRVSLIPESGSRINVDADIDNTTTNPKDQTVNVTLPVNTLVTVQVFTR